MQLKIAPNGLMRDARDRYLAANDLSMEEYTARLARLGYVESGLSSPTLRRGSGPCPCTISTNAFSIKLLAEAYTRTGTMAAADAEVKKLNGLNTPGCLRDFCDTKNHNCFPRDVSFDVRRV